MIKFIFCSASQTAQANFCVQ